MLREAALERRVIAAGYIGECPDCRDDLELLALVEAGVEVEGCPRCGNTRRVEERFFDWSAA